MTPLEIAQQRINECRETQSTELDLSCLDLDIIPDEVFELTWLEKLNVSGDWGGGKGQGEIKEIPAAIKQLPMLVSFDCTYNQVSDLSPLNGLTALTSLSCWENQICDLSPISGLTALTFLDCSYNPINDLSPISGLTALTSLNCIITEISDLSPIRNLTVLTSLVCNASRISDLSPIKGLTSLISLDCSENEISDLSPIYRLTALSSLDCCNNQISDLSPLSGLTALASLNCSANQISDLSPLSGLTALTSFACAYNPINDLSPLYHLIISEQLTQLFVKENPICGIPPGVLLIDFFGSCATNLKNYWVDLDAGTEQRQRLKVQLVGNGRVGKTTLAEALEKKCTPDEGFQSTHGITLKNIPLKLEDEEEPVMLQLWDFGGQEIYHSTHRLFLSDDCLYLLLWAEETKEHPDEVRHPVSYWLESIHDLAPNSQVILIKNQTDRVERLLWPAELTKDLPGFRQIHQTIKISALKYLKMNALRGAIQDVISELRHKVCLTLPSSWLEVENTLASLKEKQKMIPFAHFRQLCIKAGINNTSWFAGYLHNTGVLFYREGAFQDQIILDQNWAIEAVYKLFDPEMHRPKLEELDGKFKGWLTPILWPEVEETERKIYLGFMHQCGICYEPGRKDKTPFTEREFVIPALLPETCSAADAWQQTDNDWQIDIEYAFLHRSIIERIIMRIGETYSGTAWRNGIFCNTENGQLLLECIYTNRNTSNQGKLTFHLRGQHPDQMIYMLRKLVRDVSPHHRYQEYQQKGSNAQREALPKFKETNETQSPLEERNIVSNTVKLFISYSHEDEKPFLVELNKRLKSIKNRFPKLEIWHDRDLLAGEQVHNKILQQLEEADIVVLLISPSFMASAYCFSHEMKVALKQYEDNKNIVIPVIIRTTADWHTLQIGNHTALPTDGKPVTKWDDPDDFWADVQIGISRQVERLLTS